MLERRGEPVDAAEDDRTLELYRNHLRKVDSLLAERLNFERLDIDYRQVLEAPLEQAREVGKFLGTDLDEQRMAAVVDHELYRNRR